MKPQTSIKVLLGLLTAVVLFHLSIVFKITPYEITWGGRLQNDSEMYVFELISIGINLFLAWVLLMKGGFIKPFFSTKAIRVILLVFLVLFLLNTVGNIFAKTDFEKSFSLLTLAFAILILIVLRDKNPRA